jgi:protein-tyrosine phosphatase
VIDNLLIICEGNICRSPIARALFARELPRATVVSAGTGALLGHGADPVAVELMDVRGIDLRGHSAMALNLQVVREAQLVLTMTQAQREYIETAYPFARGRVYRLCDDVDVVDPYRQDRATFDTSVAQIERGVSRWLDVISRLAS